MPQRDQEVYQFFSSLKVVFDIAFLISRDFNPGALKAYIGTFHSLLLMVLTLLLFLITFHLLLEIALLKMGNFDVSNPP